MKLAVISDIHANLPAFEAVLADIDRRGIDEILCLGDMVGKGPHPAEVFDLCMKRCKQNLLGNWEEGIAHANELRRQGETVHPRMQWNIDRLGPDRARRLRLPSPRMRAPFERKTRPPLPRPSGKFLPLLRR